MGICQHFKQSIHEPWGYYSELDLEKKNGAHLCSNPKALDFELSKRSCQKGRQYYRGHGYWDASSNEELINLIGGSYWTVPFKKHICYISNPEF